MLASIVHIVNGDWESLVRALTEMDVVRPGTNIRRVTMVSYLVLSTLKFQFIAVSQYIYNVSKQQLLADIGEVQSVAKVTTCSRFDWDLYGNWGWGAYTNNFWY